MTQREFEAMKQRAAEVEWRRVRDFMAEQCRKNGYWATLKDVCDIVGAKSPNGVFGHFIDLEKEGDITVIYHGDVCPTCGRP